MGTLRDCIKLRARLEVELIVLRHQLNIFRRQSPRRIRQPPRERLIDTTLDLDFGKLSKLSPQDSRSTQRLDFYQENGLQGSRQRGTIGSAERTGLPLVLM